MEVNEPINEAPSASKVDELIQNIETVIKGKRNQIKLVLTALLAKGHVLMEDNPGTGKTVLAKTLAHSITNNKSSGEASFKRIQFTPDLLPMDLIGSHIFDEGKKDFVFKKGPLFCNFLLADEINRASPKVQSALLECMAENQITIGETTYPLENLFFTIATQNPVEMEGTYPLPSAQLDRFFIKIYFGYVDAETELDIYTNYLSIGKSSASIKPVVSLADILKMQHECENVFIHPELVVAVKNIIVQTRQHPEINLGASTRSGIAFLKCLKAFAFVNDRNFVTEDDLANLTIPVLDHRLIYRNKEAKQKLLQTFVAKEIERLKKINLQSA